MASFIIAKAMEFLEKWIKENGLVEVDKGDDYMICKEGNNTVMYRGLYLEIPTESDVAKEIALMAKDRTLYNKYYIVTTLEVVNFIDGGLIKKLGIGVMVIDGSSIKEVMKSIPIETTPSKGRDTDQRIEHLEKVISNLEGRVKELEDKINQLMQVVNELRHSAQRGEEATRARAVEQVNVQVPDNVPSFVKDNPWLGILMSKSAT
ncbi:hypothetical protein [Caldivirga sp. UBA161]|uniref:hypothetical protein n=1 Tax=Caldivirga sp. UBA161 TaxID=1915569 RepID=UPI0025BCF4B2|nr:hypothetical protein [Caldivirga sp. UBA161]